MSITGFAKKTIAAFAVAAIVIPGVQTNCMAATYSGLGVFDVENGKWKTATTAGRKLVMVKETNNSKGHVKATAMEMLLAPTFKIVDVSSGKESDTVKIEEVGVKYVFDNVSGMSGRSYYAAVKGATFQVGTKSIKLKFSAD